MSPVVADNNYTRSRDGFAGDLFPGLGNAVELTNTSHVAFGGSLYNKNTDGSYNMNICMLDIQESDGLISFDLIFNDEIPTPIALEASDITRHSFKARWMTDNGNAESYTIELEIIKSIKPFVTETRVIENLHQTEYLLEDLDVHSCNYRIRANKGNLHTAWSNKVSVTLGDSDGILPVITNNPADSPSYTLDGVRREHVGKGAIYIKNGQKYIHK